MTTISYNEKRYQDFYGKAVGETNYSNHTYLTGNTLHRQEEDFKKEYTKAWIKYLTNSINKN
ncbi:hypothetical protein WKH56_20020 [Priestia sp. SB1]|uniref:hypothetical protein n=1 Tax=Priestia sp. SB1 TaxID=3132359 RepID=UPI00317EB9C6